MGSDCGNKDRRKERDGERELCATINHLLGVQVYLASFFFYIHSRGRKQHVGGGRMERMRKRWMGEACKDVYRKESRAKKG